jgi:glycosyltransferase involved in cell wall biosynthesis
MDALVVPSARFAITENNDMYAFESSLPYSFWARYLEVYDNVYLLGRAERVQKPPAKSVIATGNNVFPLPLPYYLGPVQFLQKLPQLRKGIKEVLRQNFAIHLRIPTELASLVIQLMPTGYPYAATVVGDPYDVFAQNVVKHPLRPFLRWWFPNQLRAQCRNACAVSYVTQRKLQQRYPPGENSFSVHFSDVDLPKNAFVTSARKFEHPAKKLITIGSLEQLYKGTDILLEAIGQCVNKGMEIELIVIGDGKFRAELEAKAVALGLQSFVRFHGQIPAGEAVRAELDAADLFVLPSRTEGLPRAMIEAMARGLPCIGSTAGGIPELLSSDALVQAGDVDSLSSKIQEIATSPTRLSQLAASNFLRVQDYQEEALHERQLDFFRYTKTTTETWLKEHKN